MSETDQNNEPSFNIQRIYLKDLSLEIPHAPQIFLEREQAEIEISIDIDATRLQEEIYEIVLTGTITNKLADGKVVFLIEAQQAGIFELLNIPEEHVSPIIGITCPTILYPYLRANVADLVTRSGFPPIHLAELNFQTMYEQRHAQDDESVPTQH